MDDIKRDLQEYAMFKERSFATSAGAHIPELERGTEEPEVVLLGDSMIERMTTTGGSHSFQPWPSNIMLPEKDLALSWEAHAGPGGGSIVRLDRVFNAGVGGDRYENIIYRLVGDDVEGRQLPSLMEMLDGCDIKLWVVQAGTNNLHPKRGLSDADVDKLRLVLRAVLRISRPEARLLLTGLFRRKDITDPLIGEANRKLENLAVSMNESLETTRIFFSPAPQAISKEEHLDDHVHLNVEGYRLWLRHLYPEVLGALRAAGGLRG